MEDWIVSQIISGMVQEEGQAMGGGGVGTQGREAGREGGGSL